MPPLASTAGFDLNPLNPEDDDDRRHLEALVWPENREQAQLMRDALKLAAQVPITVLKGDAVDRCPDWAPHHPAWGASDRVPLRDPDACTYRTAHAVRQRDQRHRQQRPLYLIAIDGDGLTITHPDGRTDVAFDVDGHLDWAQPADR